ncbi:DsbA family protein [Gordonia caeni]|uniref:Thioredoxin-like fold domain-containing protein n=1 Tax=Gordonia caeni TaxID=1007097 RepID=A0ABP7P2D7_9ACTN
MSKKKAPEPKQAPGYTPKATSSTSTYVLIGVAAVVAALIIGGLVWSNNKSYPPVEDEVLAENASFIVGNPRASTTVDVFEDLTCPHCKEFEAQSGPALAAAAEAGQLRVRYHLLTFMDDQSPSGSYSSRGAGALLCVARHGDVQVWNRVHADLFARAGGDDDPSNAQIAELAGQAGATEEARTCIADGALVAEATEMGEASQQQLSNSNNGQVATPTVLVAGSPVTGILDGDAWVGELITGGPSS